MRALPLSPAQESLPRSPPAQSWASPRVTLCLLYRLLQSSGSVIGTATYCSRSENLWYV